MADLELELRRLLDDIEELLSLASEDLLKATRYGSEKERIERELYELAKNMDGRDQLRVEKVIPQWRPVYKSGVFLKPNDVNGISPLRGVLFQLLAKYHQPQSAPNTKDEIIITAGKPYDGVKYLRSILSRAKSSIFIKDNYLKPNVLDILSEFLIENPELKVRILVAHNKRTPAFRESYIAFKNQHASEMEGRILGEDKDHPRYILIDGNELFTPDHSLDRWGIETVNVHQHKNAKDVEQTKTSLEEAWVGASPLGEEL